MRPIDLTGKTFGRLTVIGRAENGKSNNCQWLCRCACGSEKIIASTALRQGRTVSCGCYRKEILDADRTIHGMTGTPTWSVWRDMRKRCSNPKANSYKHYGGRGIGVAERWESFVNFVADMGIRPEGMSIEREDVNGNYEPGNCVWIPAPDQANNTRRSVFVDLDGETMCLKSACDSLGLSYSRVRDRMMKLGWTFEEAISEPKKINKTIYA